MSTCSKMIEGGKRHILVDAKEPALVPDLIETLRSELPDMPLTTYDDGDDFSSAAVGTDLFASGDRILVLWNLDEDNVDAAYQSLSSGSEDVLLFVQRKSVSKSRTYTKLKADCEILTLEPFDDRGCTAYAAHLLKKMGCEYDAEIPSLIVERCGRDLGAIRSEARKLSFLGVRVSREACVSAIGGASAKMFDLVDSVLRRRWGPSLSLASSMDVKELIPFIHLMQSQSRRLYLCSLHRDAGMTPDEVASVVGLPPFIVKTKMIPVAIQLGRPRILKLMDLLASADVSSRVSRLPKRELFEAIVARLMRI